MSMKVSSVAPFSVADGMSLSLPFVMSSALSTSGVIAAGTADGQLWLGFGGEKHISTGSSGAKKKQSRKWEGLKEDAELLEKVAEGPVVAVFVVSPHFDSKVLSLIVDWSRAFSDPNTLTVSTLLGMITQYQIARNDKAESVDLVKIWQRETQTIDKVNALITDDRRIIVGGLAKDGKGVVEVWNKEVVPNIVS